MKEIIIKVPETEEEEEKQDIEFKGDFNKEEITAIATKFYAATLTANIITGATIDMIKKEIENEEEKE